MYLYKLLNLLERRINVCFFNFFFLLFQSFSTLCTMKRWFSFLRRNWLSNFDCKDFCYCQIFTVEKRRLRNWEKMTSVFVAAFCEFCSFVIILSGTSFGNTPETRFSEPWFSEMLDVMNKFHLRISYFTLYPYSI